MRRLALGLALIVLACGVAHAQPTPLLPSQIFPGPVEDEPPDIELITFGVGDLIFEKFGHAAICLRYHNPAYVPVCFNYGATNFHAGSILIWRFLRSEQVFWVEPEALDSIVGFYTYEDRDIWVQTLPLDATQKRAIEAKLWSDYEEKNRFYVYDHFYDNCTTRIRDIIDNATLGKLRGNTSESYPLTFRQLGARGLASAEPLVALTDFVVGRQTDEHPTVWEAMFHPEVLRHEVTKRYRVEPKLIYKRNGPEFPHEGGTGRWLFLVLILVFTLPLVIARWKERFTRAALAWAVLYPGTWGLLIWILVVLSSIPGMRWNEAVLVLVPFDLALPFLGETRRRKYARVRVMMLLAISALCAIGVLHQPLWIPILTAIVPLAVVGFWK
ncbi:MAG: DUF4105 domain-containing protein [Deltaproteobacteria bacterium]|nr:DUF4105 domain-containing protein [Deltaproteobacteria bacterium]